MRDWLDGLLRSLALRFVPRRWRDDVERDLIEESAARPSRSIGWGARQALGIGFRLRSTASLQRDDVRGGRLLEALAQDARFSLRTLIKQPAWTLTAVLTLAVGLGANFAVFGVLQSTILNPLPFRNAERLVIPWRVAQSAGFSIFSRTRPVVTAWRSGATTLEAIEEFSFRNVTLTGHGDPVLLRGVAMSATLPEFAGVKIIAGRGFAPEDTQPGGPAVALLGEVAWRARFAKDPGIIGRVIVLDGTPHTVVGVISDAIRFPDDQPQARREVFLPLIPRPDAPTGALIARMRPGFTTAQVTADLDAAVAAAHAEETTPGRKFTSSLSRPGDGVAFRDSLVLIAYAVGFVMLLAALNVAHLLIARGLARERELAIRGTLGATWRRLTRQLVTECVMLAVAGGATGVLLGDLLLRVLTALRPAGLDAIDLAAIDYSTIGLGLAATVALGAVLGLVASWRAVRVDVAGTLRATGTSSTDSAGRLRLRSVLVIAEVAIAAVLLVGAALLTRSVINIQSIGLGFETRNLYSLRVPLPADTCGPRAPAASAAFCRGVADEWLERTRALPGVEGATLAAVTLPHTTGFTLTSWETSTGATAGGGPSMTATNSVQPNYFSVTGIPITEGRGFDDGSPARGEVIVNQALARKLWPGGHAVGQKMRGGLPPALGAEPPPWLTVVGVTGDVAIMSTRRQVPPLAVYYASATGGYTLLFRARSETRPGPSIREIALDLSPSQALPVVTNIFDAFDAAGVASDRFTMRLLGALAGLATFLCAVGLYGVISYLVSQRTREIGVRLALGGRRIDVGRLVLSRAAMLTATGLLIGLGLSRWAATFIASTLYGVAAFDLVAYAAGSILLIVVAIAACIAPVRRAMRVDPVIAMRTE